MSHFRESGSKKTFYDYYDPAAGLSFGLPRRSAPVGPTLILHAMGRTPSISFELSLVFKWPKWEVFAGMSSVRIVNLAMSEGKVESI